MSTTIISFALLLSLGVCIVGSEYDVTFRRLEESNWVEVGPSNYAIKSQELSQRGWMSVSVNAAEVIIYGQNCQTETKQITALSQDEQNSILEAQNRLRQLETRNNPYMNSRYQVVRYLATGGSISSSSNGISTNQFGNEVTSTDHNNFSVSKPGMTNDLQRVLVSGEVITYVYRTGKVEMKPIACLDQTGKQFLESMRAEVVEQERKFAEWQKKFNDDMEKAFPPGFPFHNQQGSNMVINDDIYHQTPGALNHNNNLEWNAPQYHHQFQQPQFQQFQPQQFQPQQLQQQQLNEQGSMPTQFQQFQQQQIPQQQPYNNHMGSGNWPLGSNNNPFASGNWPFGNNNNPFASGNWPFGNNNNPFG